MKRWNYALFKLESDSQKSQKPYFPFLVTRKLSYVTLIVIQTEILLANLSNAFLTISPHSILQHLDRSISVRGHV